MFSSVDIVVGRSGRVRAQCDSSQLTVVLDLDGVTDVVTAYVHAEDFASLVTNALGFSLGCGYSVEVIQVIGSDGTPHVFGVQPTGSLANETLGFPDHVRVFNQVLRQAASDIFFRFAVGDFVRALTEVTDCAQYCYRAVEGIKGGVGLRTGDNSWQSMHDTLGTDRQQIEETIKAFADPIRHGNWITVRPTSGAQRYAMLTLTRDILAKYLDYVPTVSAAPLPENSS